MAYIIDPENCVACGACADACPQGTIFPKGSSYVIKADGCVDCGACESTCPNDAIKSGAD